MIRNKGNKIYVEASKHPLKRLNEHNHKRGALFTKNNPSFEAVFLEEYSNFTEARKREIQIKKWRRDKKEALIIKYAKGLETKK
jgi:putative endonuclease